MPKPIQYLRSALNRLRETAFKGLFRARFRYDVFISYSHSDKGYATSLKNQLSSLDFACFIDEEEAPPGSSLGPTLEKALKKSAILVLLATERALTRPYIALEVEKFISTGRTIVPISISGSLSRNDEEVLSKAPWSVINDRKLIWIDETEDAFAKKNPSPPIADGIDKLFKYTRRNVRVRTEIIATAVLVLLAAFGAGLIIKGKTAEVSKQSRLAEDAKQETVKQLGIAKAASEEANRQLEKARLAGEEAKRQGELAETAKKEARQQQEIAKVATAEAEKQQKLAHAATLEADRQLERGRHLLYDSDMNLAQSAYSSGDTAQVSQLLDAHLPTSATPNRADLRGFDWFYLWRLTNNEHGRLNGYTAPMAFSPNNKTLAIGGTDNTLKLRDTTAQKETLVPGFTGPLYSVMFSPDGKLLITDGKDGIVKLWDLSSNPPKDIRTIRERASTRPGPRGSVLTPGLKEIPATFSRDGKTLAAWNDDSVNLWDATTRKDQGSLKSNLPTAIRSVGFAPDGKTIVIEHDENLLEFWDLRGSVPRELEMLREETNGIATIVAFSPDGRALVTENREDSVKLWDLSANVPRQRALLEKTKWHVFGTFSPDGKRFILVGNDGSAEVWDTSKDTPDPAKTLAVDLGSDANQYPSAAISADGNTLAIWKGNEIIKLLSLETNEAGQLTGELATLKIPEDTVDSVEFSPDGQTLAALCHNGTMKVWDLANKKEVATLKGHAASITNLGFSPDGKTLAAVSETTLKFWDMRSARLSPVTYVGGFYVVCDALSPNGKTLAMGDDKGDVHLLDTDSLIGSTLKGTRGDSIHVLAFTPDGSALVGGGRGTVKLWNPNEPSKAPKLLTAKLGLLVRSATFSPTGNRLAVGENGRRVQIWDTSKLESPMLIEVPSGVVSLAFSRDGRALITLGLDGNLRQWDTTLADTEAPREQKTLATGIKTVESSPDGQTMVSVNETGQVKLWDMTRLEEKKTLAWQSADMKVVALSSDTRTLAVASADVVKLVDVFTGQELATLRVRGDWHKTPVGSLIFSPNGGMLIAKTYREITLWYAATTDDVISLQRTEQQNRAR